MTTISHKLSSDLKSELKNADEIWVAVGLLNFTGLDFILQALPITCKLNFVVGIDLPTDPKALSKLLSLKGKRTINAKILTEDFFHPKVYIIKSGRQLTAFVGSANCTNGGLTDNIEMSIATKDNFICKELIDWFEKTLLPASQPLTFDFIADYKPKYDNRLKRRKKEKEEIDDLKEKEHIKLQANIRLKSKIISQLKRYRKTNEYLEHRKHRQNIVRELKKCLDYPNFKNLDLKTFFSIKELGTIVAIKVKGKILANPKRFTELMKYIIDDSIPIKTRIDEALEGKLAVEDVGKGFISKVLVAHNPKKYYLHNDAFVDRFQKPFGLELPKGLSFGEKYELIADILKEIMNETNFDDFATLDSYLWKIEA
jgi:HKD family nuclease